MRQNVWNGRRAERRRRLLLLGADLAQHGHDLAHDERQRDEDRGQHHPRQREEDLDPVVGQAAEPAAAAVEQEEREPDDDRRQRERQVDERVQRALARRSGRARSRAPARRRRPCSAGTAIAAISSVS